MGTTVITNDARTHAQAIIDRSLVWDAHAGIFPSPETDLSGVPDWAAAGVDYVSINVGFDVMGWSQVIETLSAYRRILGAMTDSIAVIRTVAEIDAARTAGKLAVSFDIEGVNALNNDIGMLSVYHELGVRQMLFAYNLNNAGCGGCHDDDSGLTDFGHAVVAEMNRLGMIVDCSHIGYRSSLQIIEAASGPVVFTHSNPTALWDHQRNIQDDQIRAAAQTGGVIGVNGMGIFLGDNDVSAETFCDHICYIADLVGPAHVGFGLDYKPKSKKPVDLGAILRSRPDFWPAGQLYDTPGIKLFAPSQLVDVLCILEQRGWGQADITGFLGGNFRRVAQQVWA